MAITTKEREALTKACQTSRVMPGGCVILGGENQVNIHVNHNGQVVVTLPNLDDMEAWFAECRSRCGNGSVATNTQAMTLTFRS
jgi:hypothetical protein